MLQKIKKLINEYADIYAQAWATGSFRDPIASMVRNDLWYLIDNYNYQIEHCKSEKELYEIEAMFHIK